MSNRTRSWRTSILLFTLIFLGASAAQAATHALVNVSWKARVLGNDFPYGSGTGIATLGTTPNTPSIMWAQSAIVPYAAYSTNFGLPGMLTITPNGGVNVITTSPAYGFYNYLRAGNQFNGPATLRKSFGTAATAMWPHATTNTTICGGLCVSPTAGTFNITPTNPSRRFGGTARLLRQTTGSRFERATVGFSQAIYSGVATPMRFIYPEVVGNYFVRGQGTATNLTTLGTQRTVFMDLVGPLTTGRVDVTLTTPATPQQTNYTGSFNLNITNLTGMVSLVQPNLTRSFAFIDGVLSVPATGGNAAMQITNITFLPEPGQLALLGAGLLGVAALLQARRR